jgi:hypothetical protein
MTSQKTTFSFYEIRIEGELGEMWVTWFEGLSIRKESGQETDRIVTVLSGMISDQPALHAVLNKIRDLNLTLLSVKKCERKGDAS